MNLGKIFERLRYPHKRTAVNYFVDDPRLVFGIPSTPNKLHVGSFIERALDENIIRALHAFLPQRLLDHLGERYDAQGYRLMLYLLVRKYRPAVVVETGVAQGLSSAFILSAMLENGMGHLYSIDLPARMAGQNTESKQSDPMFKLSDGQTHAPYEVGYIVPDYLRDRWTLILDDARQVLPSLLQKLKTIDVFYHDSLHTYEHMKFEFETAWPYLKQGGLLLSDDVLWNNAYHEICKQHKKKPMVYRSFAMIQK